ncbi:non-ribosomal peptide synthetase, partial [Flavobacterium aestuarii]|uniref:non-ribosomal peptide synthetase n=1 Tax=Flavobacterium aestuarii TaxID=3149227 RepID=UPI0032B4ADD0
MKNQSQIQVETETHFNPFSSEIERVIYSTNSQLEIWTDCIFGGNDASRAYNLSVSIKLQGSLVVDSLEYAVKTLVKRHECLRANFSPDGRFLCIYNDRTIEIATIDISNLTAAEKDNAIKTLAHEEVNFIFDFVNDPLFKVSLIKIEDFEYMLTLTFHHIIVDGVSFKIIFQELGQLYSAYIENREPDLPKPERFSDYAKKVNSFMDSSEYQTLDDFWLSVYKDSVPVVELPIDNLRPSLRTYNSHCLDFPLEDSIINSLKDIGIRAGSSLTSTLFAAFEVFLSKFTGQSDLVIGFPFSGNTLYDMKQLIGNCVNMLPMRSIINPNISFIEHLKQKNLQFFDAYEHQQVSFGHLLKSFAIARDPSRIPLIPVVLTVDLNRDIESDFAFKGLIHEYNINPRQYGSFEIQIHAFKTKKGSSFHCTYNTSLFKKETIILMMTAFEEIIHKLISNPDTFLADIIGDNYLSAYSLVNSTEISYPDVTLTELLRKQAVITPDNIALEFNDSTSTYSELHKKVNQLAHCLKAQGIQSGDFIAVSFPRSPELLYTLLAILQCGAAYLPLDPEYPKSRLEFMLIDSRAKVLLTSKTLAGVLPQWPHTLFIEDAMDSLHQFSDIPVSYSVTPDDLAYILYTSGSTGNPKGVPITHKNLVNFLCSMAQQPGINENDRLLSITTISFDIAGLELYLPLIKGAALVLADHETARDGRLLLELIKKKNISFLQATPTTWLMLL